jgi:hypothetical protein
MIAEESAKLRAGTQDATAKNTLKLLHMMEVEPNIPLSDLRKIKCPVLVMGGDFDVIKPSHTLEIFENIAQAYLWIFPESGHGAVIAINSVPKCSIFSRTRTKNRIGSIGSHEVDICIFPPISGRRKARAGLPLHLHFTFVIFQFCGFTRCAPLHHPSRLQFQILIHRIGIQVFGGGEDGLDAPYSNSINAFIVTICVLEYFRSDSKSGSPVIKKSARASRLKLRR